jgi:predicted phosphoribosyltransferase
MQTTKERTVFIDRKQAGYELARRIRPMAHPNPVVYALPRGGVPVAAEIAAALKAPLDLVLVRKLGAPMQPELALGAIVEGDEPIKTINDDIVRHLGISREEIEQIAAAELAEIARRRQRYLGSRRPISPHGHTAIIVDDGIATGATIRTALRALRRQGAAQIVIAVPVAPADTLNALTAEVDAVVCLEKPEHFSAVGAYYSDFHQVSDAEVTQILTEFSPRPKDEAE